MEALNVLSPTCNQPQVAWNLQCEAQDLQTMADCIDQGVLTRSLHVLSADTSF